MQIESEIKQLLQELGSSKINGIAYDTAWVARTIELGESMGKRALEWIRENQLPSGCWGSSRITYYHDRVISTLSSIIVLAKWGNDQDQQRIEHARLGLDNAIRGLPSDIAGATVGFEMLAPILLQEAFENGAIQRQQDLALSVTSPYPKEHSYQGKRRIDSLINKLDDGAKKLAALPDGFVDRRLTMAFSAEMMGKKNINLLNSKNLQEDNGSLGCSPSATAYFATSVDRGNEAALGYLRLLEENNIGKGFPVVTPYDLFEITWALWNLTLPTTLSDELKRLCVPFVDYVKDAWDDEKGIGFSVKYTPKDGDDTGLAFEVLKYFGHDIDIRALLRYLRNDHFYCYETEADPSMSANIHALGALKQAGFGADDGIVQSIVSFLRSRQVLNAFWYDKWHASPYYATSHAIIVGAGYIDDKILSGALEWLLSTQQVSGAWGYYNTKTAEETAYALQALLIWHRNGGDVPKENIEKGLNWLKENSQPPYPSLWICKALYSPELIIRSTVYSALLLGEEIL